MLDRRALLAGVASLALTLSACGLESDASEAGSGSDAEGATVGVAMPTRASDRWLTDGKSVVSNLKTKGYKAKLVYGDDDPKAQVAQIEKLIEQGVSALIIAAIDNRSLNGVLKKAADAKIPVIAYDRLILGTKNVDYYVSFDNEMVGRMQAHYIIEKLGLEDGKKGPFTIELFAGSPDDNNTKYFFAGSMALLQPFLDDKQLVVPSGQTELDKITTLRWDGPTAEKRMSGILAKYGTQQLDAVLSPYDGISRGVLAALHSNGYGTAGRPLPIVTGQDAELESVKSIIAGQQAQTVYKDVRRLADAAVTVVDDILNDRIPWVDNSVGYKNGVKAVPAVLLQPTSVDKTNYDVLIKDDYFTEDELK